MIDYIGMSTIPMQACKTKQSLTIYTGEQDSHSTGVNVSMARICTINYYMQRWISHNTEKVKFFFKTVTFPNKREVSVTV